MEQNTSGIKSHSKGITIPPDAWLVHWQGHRRLTRRMIELYPDEQFFNYSLAGMRPFSGLVMEMIRLSAWGMRGINRLDIDGRFAEIYRGFYSVDKSRRT